MAPGAVFSHPTFTGAYNPDDMPVDQDTSQAESGTPESAYLPGHDDAPAGNFTGMLCPQPELANHFGQDDLSGGNFSGTAAPRSRIRHRRAYFREIKRRVARREQREREEQRREDEEYYDNYMARQAATYTNRETIPRNKPEGFFGGQYNPPANRPRNSHPYARDNANHMSLSDRREAERNLANDEKVIEDRRREEMKRREDERKKEEDMKNESERRWQDMSHTIEDEVDTEEFVVQVAESGANDDDAILQNEREMIIRDMETRKYIKKLMEDMSKNLKEEILASLRTS